MSKTFEELRQKAEEIRTNQLPESNTATLIGAQLVDMVEKQKEETYLRTKSDKILQENLDTEKKERITAMTEANVSVLCPTSGYKTDGGLGGDLYDLALAITTYQGWLNTQSGSSQIIKGTVLKFSDRNNHDVVSFEFLGGTVTDVTNWNALPFFRYVSNDEFLKAVVDANGILLFGIRYDGTIYQSDIDDKTKDALAKVNIFIEDEFAKFKEYVKEEFEKVERVFDGGYPETLYGGARTINCGTI